MKKEMKKYRGKLTGIILLTLFILGFSLFKPVVNNSYAQTYKSIKFFDMSNPIYQTHITKSQLSQSDTSLQLAPVTQIIIKKGSFTEDTDVSVYQANWNLLTQGANSASTPISAYYIVFLNAQNKELTPLQSVSVLVSNNFFPGTIATFTPIVKDTGIVDAVAMAKFPNQATIQATLPVTDGGYIISINKVVDRKLLGQKQTGSSPLNSLLNQNVYLILLIAVIIIAIAGFAYTMLSNNSRRLKNQP